MSSSRETLATNAAGVLAVCVGCGCYELLFGNVMLALKPDWLRDLANALARQAERQPSQSLILETGNPNLKIVVQPEQREPLRELLAAGLCDHQVNTLLHGLGIAPPADDQPGNQSATPGTH